MKTASSFLLSYPSVGPLWRCRAPAAMADVGLRRFRRPAILLRPPSFPRPSNAFLATSSFVPVSEALQQPPPPLDLTEGNVKQVLADARIEMADMIGFLHLLVCISSPRCSSKLTPVPTEITHSDYQPHYMLPMLTTNSKMPWLERKGKKFGQIFDASVGITGVAELAELDGPFVRISLRGRFWHERSTVLARLGNYLKQRIPEILEVDIEDEKQLDDSPENF